MKELIFYYDVICPYANLAAKLIEDVAKRNQAKLVWRPVLLGGIYKLTKHQDANIPDNKMIKTYSDHKRKILGQDLGMQYSRYNVTITNPTVPDMRTLNAMRLIASTPDECDELRRNLTHQLFDAVWIESKDVANMDVLQSIADNVNLDVDVRNFTNNKGHPARNILERNTNEAVQRGAFGVPSIWLNEKLFFGSDRLFFLEQELGNTNCQPHRLLQKPTHKQHKKLTFYFDYASPWSYMAFKRIPKLLNEMEELGVSLEIEYVPVLIGGLFTMIGTPGAPVFSMGENKRNYHARDMRDWLRWKGIPFTFNTNFPVRTVLPLRLTLPKMDYKLMSAIYEATWVDNRDVSDETVMREVVTRAGYDFEDLHKQANSPEVKQKLKDNTNRAFETGLCGLPSFQVDDGPVVFGQDRMNVVEDMLLGWEFKWPESVVNKNSKL